MALVANVTWNCPGCGQENCAQVFRGYEQESNFEHTQVPANCDLRWYPPCKNCGEYQPADRPESESEELTEIPIVKTYELYPDYKNRSGLKIRGLDQAGERYEIEWCKEFLKYRYKIVRTKSKVGKRLIMIKRSNHLRASDLSRVRMLFDELHLLD